MSRSNITSDGTQELAYSGTLKDVERNNLVHRMEMSILGELCWKMDEVRQALAPKGGETIRVLDIYSGHLIWAFEMAKEFPHVEVVCIEKAFNHPSNAPFNCKFEAIDLLNENIEHLYSRFDLVRCTRPSKWVREYKPVLERIIKAIKPGGIFYEIDGEFDTYDQNKQLLGPAYDGQTPGTSSWFTRLWHEVWPRIATSPEKTSSHWDKIEGLLKANPIIESVKARHTYIPIGWSGTDEDDIANREEAGKLAKANYMSSLMYPRPILIAGGIPVEEVDRWTREAEADINALRIKGYTRWHFHIARVRLEN